MAIHKVSVLLPSTKAGVSLFCVVVDDWWTSVISLVRLFVDLLLRCAWRHGGGVDVAHLKTLGEGRRTKVEWCEGEQRTGQLRHPYMVLPLVPLVASL